MKRIIVLLSLSLGLSLWLIKFDLHIRAWALRCSISQDSSCPAYGSDVSITRISPLVNPSIVTCWVADAVQVGTANAVYLFRDPATRLK